jgi:hypothetical protein
MPPAAEMPKAAPPKPDAEKQSGNWWDKTA